MKARLIDILSPLFIVFNNKNSKAFFILLGLVEKVEEMAINLANRLFSHFFITFGNVSPTYINSANATCKIIDKNLFAYIDINWYLFDKFYRTMINTGAFQHFTIGYGQFIAYIRNIKYTIIDIFKADKIYIQFNISLILSIESVLI